MCKNSQIQHFFDRPKNFASTLYLGCNYMFYLHRLGNERTAMGATTAILLCVITTLIYAPFGVDAQKRYYHPTQECGLYLAPSSIPGAGLGMYSGSSEYAAGTVISDADLMIPTWDLDYHNGNDKYYHLWDEYTWSSSKLIHDQYSFNFVSNSNNFCLNKIFSSIAFTNKSRKACFLECKTMWKIYQQCPL